MKEKVIFNSEDVSNNKVFGILSYLWILVLIPIFAAKDSPYAKFHANQGLVLFIAEVALNIAVRIIAAILSLSIMGTLFAGILSFAVMIVSLIFMILGIVNACSDEAKELPLIGGISILK